MNSGAGGRTGLYGEGGLRRVSPQITIRLKKSLFDYFTPVLGPENGGGLAVFRGFSAESNYKLSDESDVREI